MYCVRMLEMVLEDLRANVIQRSTGNLVLSKSTTPENFQMACEKLVETLVAKAVSDAVPQVVPTAQLAAEACFTRVLRNQKTLQDFIGLSLTDKDDHLVLDHISDLSPPGLTEKKQLIAIRAIKRIEAQVQKLKDQVSGVKKEIECSVFSQEIVFETDHVYVSAKEGKLFYTMRLHNGTIIQDVATDLAEPSDLTDAKMPIKKILEIVKKNGHAKTIEDKDLYEFSTKTLKETHSMSRILRGEHADKEEASLDGVLKLSLDIVGEFKKFCKNFDSKNQVPAGSFFSLQGGKALGEQTTPVQNILDILMQRVAKNYKRAFEASAAGMMLRGIVQFSGETASWYHRQNSFIADKLKELYVILKDQIKEPTLAQDQNTPAFWAGVKNFLTVMGGEATKVFDGVWITSPTSKAITEIQLALHQSWPKDFVIKLN